MAISVKQAGTSQAAINAAGTSPTSRAEFWRRLSHFGRPISARERIFFTSQLSLMLEIGTPLSQALRALRDQTQNESFKAVIGGLVKDIEEGRQLSEAMKRYPQYFGDVFVSMIKAGEAGGFLQDILDRVVEMQEKRRALIAQIRSALTYPAILSLTGLLVVVFVLVFILPKFTVFFRGKESILPWTTRFLMLASDSLRVYWWAYALTAGASVVGLYLFAKTERGRAVLDLVLVKAPLVARLTNKIYTCDLLRILGHLLSSRVPLVEALEVTRGTIKNRYFRRFIDQIRDHVLQGGRFAQPFATYPFILESVKQMVVTGEETGNLFTVMLRLAKFYDDEVDDELKTIASMIEPAALIVLGAVVGLIVASVVLPMFKLARAVQ